MADCLLIFLEDCHRALCYKTAFCNGNLLKKSSAQLKIICQSLVPNLNFWAFLVSCFERIEIFFFQMKKIKNSIIFVDERKMKKYVLIGK
jgi:hypothetical protein